MFTLTKLPNGRVSLEMDYEDWVKLREIIIRIGLIPISQNKTWLDDLLERIRSQISL